MPKISIITPTHNPQYIMELWETIKSQTFKDWEWIIVENNGAKVEINDPRVRIITCPFKFNSIGFLKKYGFMKAKGEFIAEEIMEKVRSHERPAYTDFVVLYRTNAQSRVIEEVFLRYGIPYKIVGGVKFYERKEIKDLLAYLRIAQNPHDTVSLLRVINTPPRNIGLKTLETLQKFALAHDLTLFDAIKSSDVIPDLNDGKKEILHKFYKLWKKLIESNQQFPASGVIKTILHLSGYKEFILDNGTPEGEIRYENVRELISVATKYDQLEPGLSLVTFLEEVSLISDLDRVDTDEREKGERDNAVTLMTLHQAKGLEYPCVFIAGLEEGIFPHNRSLFEPEQLEEERRLMYVGVTRAEQDLYLLHARQRLLYGEYLTNVPSQFLEDIPAELVERNVDDTMLTQRSQSILDPDQIGHSPVPMEDSDLKPPSFRRKSSRSSGQPRASGQSRGQQGHSRESGPSRTTPITSADVKFPGQTGPKRTPRLDKFNDGDRVKHKTFGEGVVVNVIGGVITIAFKDPKVGIKKLAVSIAPITKIQK